MVRDIVPLHGGQLQQIADSFKVPASSLFDFSANINPDGPPTAVRTALRHALDEPSILTSYPELNEPVLRNSIAAYAAIEPENIAVANGFVPLLDAALRALSIRKCLVPIPAFIEYRRTLEHSSVEVLTETLKPESYFQYDMESLLNGSHDAILLANPQNPTGILHDRETLLDLTLRAAERNILILLDEAFVDYTPRASLAAHAEQHRNLVVFRSLTKFFGMPGLRVGYAVSNVRTISQVRDQVAPWAISTLASHAAAAGLADKEYVSETIALNDRRRTQLERMLRELSLEIEPSSANFILFRLPEVIDPVVFWRRMIEEHRIVLRLCSDYESLPRGYLRAAVRTDPENRMLIEALRPLLVSYETVSRLGPLNHSTVHGL